MSKAYFMNPGPTPVPERVKRAMSVPLFSHRSQEFGSLFGSTAEKLKYVFQTEREVIVLTSSGTGAMEASLQNTLQAGDRVLGVSIGNFGDRFISIAKNRGLEVDPLRYQEGLAASPEEVLDRVKKESYQAVLITHHETSTGTVNDIETIGKLIGQLEHPPLLIVDAISSLGAIDLKPDQWQLDLVITSSQKALMTPPGLAMICISSRAWEKIANNKERPFYYDLQKAREYSRKHQTPYTPALTIILGLNEALSMIEEEGLERVFRRHLLLMKGLRAGIRALGLELLVADRLASPAVTTVCLPRGIAWEELQQKMKNEHRVTVAGGKKKLAGKVFRIGHLGYFSPEDILATLKALEKTLADLGHSLEKDAGTKAAEKIFQEEI